MSAAANTITLTHWGAYQVVTQEGRVRELRRLPDDLDPSPIGASMVGALDDALRIRQPMVRAGFLEHGAASRERRGTEPFVPIGWDEATRLVANEIRRVAEQHGNRAIFGGSYGWASAGRFHHAQSQLHRFLNLAGGYTRSVNTHSHAAAEVLLPHIIGNRDGLEGHHTSWGIIAAHTELFLAFGGVPLKNAQVSAGGVGHHCVRKHLADCHRRGTKFINIGPLRSDLDPAFDPEWLQVRPATDTALMLGLAHTLVAEGLHDEAFLQRYTVGFDRFRPYLLGEVDHVAKSADWAAPICGMDAEIIRALARRMVRQRTMIAVSWSLQRAEHGEQPLWMAMMLAALLGQIGLPGGGFGFGYGGSNRVGTATRAYSWPAVPQGLNPVRDFIPVARLADMLLSPGERFEFNGGSYGYPDIKLVYWAGGNPFHHQQDLNKLARAWRRPETVIVHEPWWNALAKQADIVMPCTTSLERNDLGIARDEGHLFAMHQAVEPIGSARSDFAILTDIAVLLGFADAFTDRMDEMGWVRHLYGLARQRAAAHGLDLPMFETFWQKGEVRLTPPEDEILLARFRADPDGNRLDTPSGKIELVSDRISGFGYSDCPGHPVWLEPTEWLGMSASAEFPLHLVSNQPATRLHSQYDHGNVSQASKVAGCEPIRMHSHDAASRDIQGGEVVLVSSPRGQCLAGAVLDDDVSPGCVQLSTGAWFDPVDIGRSLPLDRQGNPNVLTVDRGTSRLAQGPTAHTTMVQIVGWSEPLPAVGPFTPPQIDHR